MTPQDQAQVVRMIGSGRKASEYLVMFSKKLTLFVGLCLICNEVISEHLYSEVFLMDYAVVTLEGLIIIVIYDRDTEEKQDNSTSQPSTY